MDARRIIGSIEILRAIEGGPTSITDAAANCSSSESKIRRFVQECEDSGLVYQSGNGYGLTTTANLILREQGKLDDEEQARLVSFAKLEKQSEVLRALNRHPADKASLRRKSGASHSTVYRTFDDFSEWIEESNDHLELSSTGETTIESYENLHSRINIIGERVEFLNRYEAEKFGVEVPIEALAESRQVVSEMGNREKVVQEINDINPDDAEPLRGLSHEFSSQISDQAYADLPPETDAELIVGRSVYKTITHPRNWRYLLESRHYPNFQLLVLPGNITTALGVYGSREAVIGVYSEEHPLHVALFSENEKFIEWAEKLYEHFRASANTIPKDLIKWAIGR